MRRYALWAVLLVGAAGRLGAQQPCDSVVARAFNEFDASRMLIPALDPRVCPPQHASWAVGVQLLGETLIEGGRDSLATLWLRWALRLAPEMKVDTVVFTPRLAAAYQSARGFVGRSVSGGDSLVVTTWLWPTADVTGERQGRIQVAAAGVTVPVRVEVKGIGLVGASGSIPVNPGSYEIRAAASGFDSTWVMREVLPGITTVLELHLRPVVARVVAKPPSAPAVPPQERVAEPQKKKRFPVVLAVVGVAGAGALVAILAGGGNSSEPPTGGITITFPNP